MLFLHLNNYFSGIENVSAYFEISTHRQGEPKDFKSGPVVPPFCFSIFF